MNFHEKLKKCIKEKNIKQIELARLTNITPSSISDWLKGKYIPKHDKVVILAKHLDVNPNWLLGIEEEKIIVSNHNNLSINKIETNYETEEIINNTLKIPLLGTICAGDGIFAEENFEDFMFIDQSTKADFALKVKGDSMIDAGIFDGDIVFIKKQTIVSNGKIAAVLLTDSEEATLKKFYKKSDHILLQPCNSDYEPIVTRHVQVIGECVGVYRKL